MEGILDNETAVSVGNFAFDASSEFSAWLADQKISLAASAYQASKILLIGQQNIHDLNVFMRTFYRPMGLWSDGQSMLLSSGYQIHQFQNILKPDEETNGFDRVFLPQLSYITGELHIHDIVKSGETSEPVFINTLYSCLATTSLTHSFRSIWKPDFITDLAPEDRCHLNGLATIDSKPAFVTALAKTDSKEGWRKYRNDGGVLIDISSNEIVASGLSMPHSPRWHHGKLWLANSGTGEFGYIDMSNGHFQSIVFCPGYIRGISFHNNYAFLGLSRPRNSKTFEGLALDTMLEKQKSSPRSGIYIVNLDTGNIVHWFHAEGAIEELYDVAVLPDTLCPAMIGFQNNQVKNFTCYEPE